MAASIDRVTPLRWGETLGGKPILDVRLDGAVPVLIRRWRGIPPDIDQSPLVEHYLSIHLGGTKRLCRIGEGRRLVRDACSGAHSFVPAGSGYRWNTEGPVDFVHFYFAPKTIDLVIADGFDRNPQSAEIRDCLGINERLIDALSTSILTEISYGDGIQQAYLDGLLHLLVFRLLRCYSNAASTMILRRHALAPYRLRAAIDFIDGHLAEPIGVSEIASAAGMSMFHFSRAFRTSTGVSPYSYLLQKRVAAAKTRLRTPVGTLATIAGECGFSSPSQFSRMFKQVTGFNPGTYRRRQ